LQANRSKSFCPKSADAIVTGTALTLPEINSLQPDPLMAALCAKRKRFRAHIMHADGEPRVLIVDSGATYHVVDFDSISDEEQLSKRKLSEPMPLLGLQGVIFCEYECDVWINELQLVITAMLVPGTPAVLSMGKLVRELGFEMSWKWPEPLTLIRGHLVVKCWDELDVPRLTTIVGVNKEQLQILGTSTKLREIGSHPSAYFSARCSFQLRAIGSFSQLSTFP